MIRCDPLSFAHLDFIAVVGEDSLRPIKSIHSVRVQSESKGATARTTLGNVRRLQAFVVRTYRGKGPAKIAHRAAIFPTLKSFESIVLDVFELAKFAAPFSVGELTCRMSRQTSAIGVNRDLLVAQLWFTGRATLKTILRIYGGEVVERQ